MLFATFQSQAPVPGSGGLKILGGVSQFCAVNIGFPTMGASFEIGLLGKGSKKIKKKLMD